MKTTNTNNKKVNLTSSNLSEEKLAELHRLLPEAFSENKIDWEKLRTVLGDDVDSHIEKFGFTWAGKGNAIKNVLIPSKATLTPIKDESIKFDDSENIFVEGDNLEALKLLQKAYFEKVKMIYIDPPYNTGGDFVYKDNFASPVKNYLEQTGQKDSEGNNLQTNKETNGRYHSDWLSMMYPRLKLSWNLLRNDGVIFVSIDDNEVHNLRQVMNEIYGEENFVACVVWKRKRGRDNSARWFSKSHEYLLVYAKDVSNFETNFLELDEETKEAYKNPDNDERGVYRMLGIWARGTQGGVKYDFTNKNGQHFAERLWLVSKANLQKLDEEDKLLVRGDNIYRKLFITENQGKIPETIWDNTSNAANAADEIKAIFGGIIFDTPKPLPYIREMLKIATKDDDIVLDFFAGSATTAHAVMLQNIEDGSTRRWICVQLPEKIEDGSDAYNAGYRTIADISKDRIRKVINGYGDEPKPIDSGFKVFKLAESNYPENNFEFDPAKSEGENRAAFEEYLTKAKQPKLLEEMDEMGVVYENIVKEGFSLNSKITEEKIGKNSVYIVVDGERQLLVCLDNEIGEKTISELTGKEYKGKVFICFDNALNDSAKANLGLNVELKTI
jgi:adenine-specific DNA-methyltransferase